MENGVEREFVSIVLEPWDNCEYVYILDVESCELDPTHCIPADPEFAGRFPGWNREGKLIHEYMGWTVQGNCHFSELGVWDGTSLNPILTGQWPDAASGLPYDG
jgi:hypothetical protein